MWRKQATVDNSLCIVIKYCSQYFNILTVFCGNLLNILFIQSFQVVHAHLSDASDFFMHLPEIQFIYLTLHACITVNEQTMEVKGKWRYTSALLLHFQGPSCLPSCVLDHPWRSLPLHLTLCIIHLKLNCFGHLVSHACIGFVRYLKDKCLGTYIGTCKGKHFSRMKCNAL